jgi:hypothetical protein
MSTENWGTPNKVQNYNSNQQNNNTNQNYANNSQGVSADSEEYQDYQSYQDDRYLRLKVANRNRWSTIDDWGYWNDPRFNNAFLYFIICFAILVSPSLILFLFLFDFYSPTF